jgi:hypothetical protein
MTDEFDELLNRVLYDQGFRGGQVTTLIRYRAGGHSGADWAYPGDTARPGMGAMLLVGSAKWTGVAASSGGFEVTLPAPFAGSPVAIAVPTLTIPAYTGVMLQVAPDAYQLTVYWSSLANITELWVSWLAAGLPAVG